MKLFLYSVVLLTALNTHYINSHGLQDAVNQALAIYQANKQDIDALAAMKEKQTSQSSKITLEIHRTGSTTGSTTERTILDSNGDEVRFVSDYSDLVQEALLRSAFLQDKPNNQKERKAAAKAARKASA